MFPGSQGGSGPEEPLGRTEAALPQARVSHAAGPSQGSAIVVESFYLIGIITMNILLLVGKSFVFLFFIYHDIILANFSLR